MNLDIPLHREAWHVLRGYPPGSRTEEVCRAVLWRRDMEHVREILREELQNVKIQQPAEEPVQDTASDDRVMDFLRSLQEGADFI